MEYDESNVSERQKKIAQKCINCVMDGFQLEKPPSYVIKGLNPNEEITKLEYQKLKENEMEIKKIEKDIKFARNYANNFVKVVFEFNNNLKRLIYMSEIMKTTKYFTAHHMWSGVLDFPITNSFIFGRVSNKERHGGGNYYFAPFEKLKDELLNNFEKVEENIPDLFPYKIIESNPFIQILSDIKFTFDVKESLRKMPKKIKSNKTTTPLVDKLNQQKELIKVMKKIPHFTATQGGVVKFVSKIDVSTIFIPYKEVTYFHIDQFTYSPKKHCRAIYSLLNVLEKLNL